MKTITLTPDASGMVDWPTLSNDKKSVVTIGSFDGMHQGHQAVIRRVAELAEREQAFSVVVLFDPRPALVHAYAAKHDGQEPPAGTPDTQALTSVDERLRAIDAIGKDNSENCEALRKGVELTENELTKVFNKFGIKKMEIMDTVFDPNFHQVIQEVEDKEKPNGTIIAELQTGYMLNDRILREAMVVVTKGGK